jgi:RES domain-containing protein
MLVYRLGRTGYPPNDGTGAALYGGRWNPVSFAVIYAADSRALCVLEVLVHNAEVSAEYSITTIHVPDDLQTLRLSDNDLPRGWNGPLAPSSFGPSQMIGARWIRSEQSAVLQVPSVVIPEEWNYVLNPAHPDFARIEFSRPVPFRLDERLRAFQA